MTGGGGTFRGRRRKEIGRPRRVPTTSICVGVVGGLEGSSVFCTRSGGVSGDGGIG